jgi:hypothetical protein
MIDYKYPTIASGATPIGSAGRAPDEQLLQEDNEWRTRKKILSPLSAASTRNIDSKIYSHRESGFKNPMILAIAFEVKDFKKSKIEEVKDWWKSKISRSRRLKHLKIEEVEELKKSKFGDSTRVCNSSRVSGATDVGMPFRYPQIIIPGSAHYVGGPAQGLKDWLGDEERQL